MRRALLFAIGLNTLFVVAEAVAGVLAHSASLLADAAHNLSDVLGLGLAWAASRLATRAPTLRRTYGLGRATILAALANALLLLLAVGGVLWESLERFVDPPAVDAGVVMLVAAIGVVINTASALLLVRDKANDANIRGAFLHLAADAAVSVGVVLAGCLIWFTDWHWVDPATSLVVCALVVVSTWGLLRESMDLALDAVPSHVDPAAVLQFLREQPGVRDVHDLHIWAMSTTEVALTAHLVTSASECRPGFLHGLAGELSERFGIQHSTMQVEPEEDADDCSLASVHKV